MKTLLLALTLLSSTSFATPERDALLGAYHGVQPDGRACYLKIQNAGGKTNIEFTDSMSSRTLRNVGKELEAQLARRVSELVFKHNRSSLGDVTVHLVIRRGQGGRPVSMSGSVAGWLRAEVNCKFLR